MTAGGIVIARSDCDEAIQFGLDGFAALAMTKGGHARRAGPDA
jgi:hypothetical protein